MTSTAHGLIGAGIAAIIPNPLLSVPLAILAHFAADKIPHWDPMTDKSKTRDRIILEAALDVLLGYFLVFVIFVWWLHSPSPGNLFLSAFAGQLPDWLEVPYTIFGFKHNLIVSNYKLQSWIHDVWFDSRLKAPWGIIVQVAVICAVVGVVYLATPR